jgi:DNA replication initiation complex subunit (GINS family)
MTEITYEMLRKIQADEKGSSALSGLPPDFYNAVRSMIAERKVKLAKSFSLSEAREFENTLKVLRDIYALREQKMLLRALAVAGGARDGSALSAEEKWAFDEVVRVLEKGKGWFEALLEGEERTVIEERAPEKHAHHEQKKAEAAEVKFLVPMPEFVGADGKAYGPYEAGAKAELPSGEAKLLIKRKAAEAA